MIDRGSKLVQKGQQDIQNGNFQKGMQEIQQGQKLISEGASQLSGQQSAPPPTACNNGQSSNPLQAAMQGIEGLAGMIPGCGSLMSMMGPMMGAMMG